MFNIQVAISGINQSLKYLPKYVERFKREAVQQAISRLKRAKIEEVSDTDDENMDENHEQSEEVQEEKHEHEGGKKGRKRKNSTLSKEVSAKSKG